MTVNSQLDPTLLQWISTLTGGAIDAATRHSARRESWRIDIRGSDVPYFLRIDRALAAGQGSFRHLRRELTLMRALATHGIPVPAPLGWNEEHGAALYHWAEGEADLQREQPAQQHPVMLDFMDVLARIQRIDISALELAEFVVPTTTAEHSLLEISAVDDSTAHPVRSTRLSPLAAFSKRWLINHAPEQVQATVLLQGDTGPANFLYADGRVTSVVDWEWGHYGDPMEDLGNIWVRDFFCPSSSGDLRPYFEHYAASSGFDLDYDSIRYYRVHQLARSVIGLTYRRTHPDWRGPIPLNLGYAAIIDLEICRALAELDGTTLPPVPELPTAENPVSIEQALALQLEHWVAPQISDPATQTLAHGHAAVLRYLDRRERHGAAFDAAELDSLRTLLGNDCTDLHSGRTALIDVIENASVNDEPPLLAHLGTVAVHQAALMAPLMEPWQHCRWARI